MLGTVPRVLFFSRPSMTVASTSALLYEDYIDNKLCSSSSTPVASPVGAHRVIYQFCVHRRSIVLGHKTMTSLPDSQESIVPHVHPSCLHTATSKHVATICKPTIRAYAARLCSPSNDASTFRPYSITIFTKSRTVRPSQNP